MSNESVAVFWDYENCPVPAQLSGYDVVQGIQRAAQKFGVVKVFRAYLELSEHPGLSKSSQLRSELQCSGVSLIDCPHNGRKDVADKMLLVDMLAHAIDTAPPSTVMLISGDRDFAYAISILRLRCYRTVLISVPTVHDSLKSQCSVFLDWGIDVLGISISPQDLHPLCENSSRYVGPVSPKRRRIAPSSTSRASLNADDGEIDIMDHLRPTLSLKPQDVAQAALSKFVDNSPLSPSSPGSSIRRVPSRTESAPAVVYSEDLSPTPTVTNNLTNTVGPANSVTLEAEPQTPHILNTPSLNGYAQGSVADKPLARIIPPFSNSGSATAIMGLPSGPQDHTVTVTSPNPLPPTFVSSEPLPYPTPPIPQNSKSQEMDPGPKEVPEQFKALVQCLEGYRARKILKPARSVVAVELAKQDNAIYRKAGTSRFGQYAALAEQASIVKLGGREGGAWIALHPDQFGTKLA